MIDNELREFIRDYLNGHNSEEELALKFNLEKCPKCESYDFAENVLHTDTWGDVCLSCTNDFDI